MDLKLTGRTALVTGSTAGIGLAIARRLMAEGCDVVVNGRGQKRVDAAIADLRAGFAGAGANGAGHANRGVVGGVYGVAADVSTAEGCAVLVAAVPRVDILINNAGMYAPVPFDEITDGQWTEIFQANVMSGIRLSRHYLPRMLEANAGRIVFISSESGVCTPTEMIHYGMSKTAQLAISRGLAQRCSGTAVTVNSVLPGPTWSEGVEQFVKDLAKASGGSAQAVEADFFKTARPNSLLKRFATNEEVADMVAFVASGLSSATNGAALRCEGGIVPTIV